MGKTADYKGTTPDGYGEQIEYMDGDSKVNTKEWKVGQIDDIKKLGKELASESEHAKILYPNADSLKTPEKEGAKGIYKSNLTGDVPDTVANPHIGFAQEPSGSLMVIGGGAIEISNQERLYKLMQSEQQSE